MKTTKNVIKGLFIALVIVCQSCTINEESIGDVTINPNGGGNGPSDCIQLSGEITSDITLTSNNCYELVGGVSVVDGVTMTIQAGTQIIAGQTSDGIFSYLLINQGAKIMAQGTADQPIILTSNKSTPNPGDWGGLIIAGRAPINRGTTATAEVANISYGGTVADDNSGIIRYMRLEYTGGRINADSEYNGLSLYGVGSGTTLEYIQTYLGNDDGIEFYGGTVDLKYAVATGAQDDSFDWTDGWVGRGQFWVVQQTTLEGDKGIEADNLSSTPDAIPFSFPTISNITLLGAEDGDGENKGIEFRAGTKVAAYNMIIKGFPGKGIEVDDDQTLINLNNGDVEVRNSIIDNVNSFDLDHGGATVDFADFATYSNYSLDGSGAPFNNAGSAIPDDFELEGFRGTYEGNAIDPSTINAWFTSVNYVGAVDSNDDWTQGWVRF
ncbi:multidrug transporter [uncultured Algibacter sp.]|uniref:multidrug transporter n=1 Tax=uncultured Algibacter sp. TaxID=298659 RepID=UPI003217F37A